MEKLNSILQDHVAPGEDTSNKLLGAAFVVVNKHEIIYAGSAGRQDFDPSSPPFTPRTFAWMASMTKIVTATCLMQLVQQGVITLDADIRGLVPELDQMQILRGFDADEMPILEPNTKPITLRHLLSHTLGLGVDTADPDLQKWSSAVGRSLTYMHWSREACVTPLKFAPGEAWYYGLAYDWAGVLLETLTGQTLGAYMEERIFAPLGLNDTGFWPERLPQTKTRTATYAYRRGVELKPGAHPAPATHEMECGGSGLFSTAYDYALFFRGLLQGKLLDEETLQKMFRPQLNESQAGVLETIAYRFGVQDSFAPEFPSGQKLNHGLGGVLNVDDVPGKRRKGSMMWSGMPNCRWWIDRETGIAAALVTSVDPHGDPVVKSLYNELELAVYDLLQGN